MSVLSCQSNKHEFYIFKSREESEMLELHKTVIKIVNAYKVVSIDYLARKVDLTCIDVLKRHEI